MCRDKENPHHERLTGKFWYGETVWFKEWSTESAHQQLGSDWYALKASCRSGCDDQFAQDHTGTSVGCYPG